MAGIINPSPATQSLVNEVYPATLRIRPLVKYHWSLTPARAYLAPNSDVPEIRFGNMSGPRASRLLAIIEGTNMNFGMALEQLRIGSKVARDGWNGKDMFLFLVPGSQFKVNRPPLLGIYPEGTEINYRPHIDMKTVDGEIVPWVASQTDVLAEDWVIVE